MLDNKAEQNYAAKAYLRYVEQANELRQSITVLIGILVSEVVKIALNKYNRSTLITGTTSQIAQGTDEVG